MAERLVIETVDLRKTYGSIEALRGLNLQVPAGSICGFLGRNGAGKTTSTVSRHRTIAGSDNRSPSMRPYVICHMMPSVDGRIITERWGPIAGYSEYGRTGSMHGADAWMCGRVTMEVFSARRRPALRRPKSPVPRTDFVARLFGSYGVAVDPSGKLNWQSSDVWGDHAITVLTKSVSDGYLAFLRSKGVSYIFGGEKALDLRRVLEKLRKRFGIRRLLLEGGGGLNGSMLRAGLIDELSILVAPVADGSVGTPTLFDVGDSPASPARLALLSTKKLRGGVVCLRYRVRSRTSTRR